ncbi:MAG: hypothetical protein JSV67_00575 [Thermoplasmatales archaeon]|nr:MAG: hypothetical protein JSV67_00575 [Thermoplasmatales archaeon]
MKWNLAADTELDEYTILCMVNKDNLSDFIDIVKKELDQWKSIEIIVPIRKLVCVVN